MNNIKQYIIEKLKLDKNIQVGNKNLADAIMRIVDIIKKDNQNYDLKFWLETLTDWTKKNNVSNYTIYLKEKYNFSLNIYIKNILKDSTIAIDKTILNNLVIKQSEYEEIADRFDKAGYQTIIDDLFNISIRIEESKDHTIIAIKDYGDNPWPTILIKIN